MRIRETKLSLNERDEVLVLIKNTYANDVNKISYTLNLSSSVPCSNSSLSISLISSRF